MAEDKPDPSVDLAQWLREVGTRRWTKCAKVQPGYQTCEQPKLRDSAPTRRTLLLALLLVASLQYVYASTTVEILSLPSLLVFVFTG